MKKFVKIVVYVPLSHAEKIRRTLVEAGCGNIGNYDFCSFSVRGTGRFRGKAGTHPFIGKPGKMEKVAEERIETICQKSNLKKALTTIKKTHPYEEPAIDIFPLLT